jgi:hypothetical protein
MGEGRHARDDGSDVMADVNSHVFALAEKLEPSVDGDELWGFMCECGDPSCNERVRLSVAAYEELRARRQPVLAPGHLRGL